MLSSIKRVLVTQDLTDIRVPAPHGANHTKDTWQILVQGQQADLSPDVPWMSEREGGSDLVEQR